MTELCSDFVFIPADRHIAHSCDAQRSEAVVRNPDANGESSEPRRRRRHGRTLDICDVLPVVRRVSELMIDVGLLLGSTYRWKAQDLLCPSERRPSKPARPPSRAEPL